MRYVIIGNSTAAVGCIESIRKVDSSGEIIVISREKYHTYSRPLISYFLLGKKDMNGIKYRNYSFYDDYGCKTILGVSVTGIIHENKYVKLDNGTNLHYDKLLVATGSVPFIPGIKGLERVKNSFTFMSLDDALILNKVITSESRVLVLGAGLIGLKCTEGIMGRVKSLTVVDMASRILPSILDEEGSDMVKKHIEKNGVNFVLGDTVEEFRDDTALLNSGDQMTFDILIIAVGVRPNTVLLAETGAKIARGIIINNRCETSIKDIYAAGDCCESYDISCEKNRVMALFPNAYMQGECAGKNMAGKYASFEGLIPMNAIGFFGLHMITAGNYEGDSYIKKGKDRYKALFYKNNTLKGYILIGDVARAGIYTSLICNQTPFDTIDFELVCEKPQLMAFTRSRRRELLGREQ